MGDGLAAVSVHDNGVAEVAINTPAALNALSPGLIAALTDTFLTLDSDSTVRVFLLTGAGRHFCAGADIKEMLAMSVSDAVRDAFTGCCHELAKVAKPVVAAVNGYAVGGGCELVEMCDIVIAASDAVFGHPEVTLATMPGAGGSQRLPRAIGKHKALDLLLTGRMMDAVEAERAGLVARIVEPDQLLTEARAVAARIAGFSQPVTKLIKQSVNNTFEFSLHGGLEIERGLFHRTLALEDSREGMEAFSAKRKAAFRDR